MYTGQGVEKPHFRVPVEPERSVPAVHSDWAFNSGNDDNPEVAHEDFGTSLISVDKDTGMISSNASGSKEADVFAIKEVVNLIKYLGIRRCQFFTNT